MAIPTTHGAQSVAEYIEDEKLHRRQLARAVNGIIKGKVNITLDITLTALAASTLISDNRITYNSAIIPAMPMTLNAATALAAGIYVDTFTASAGTTLATATIHHAISANTDQTIRFVIIG